MDAMSRSLCHIATTEDAGNRLDALCAARGLYASRSAAARAIEEGRVFVNGATVSKKHAVALPARPPRAPSRRAAFS